MNDRLEPDGAHHLAALRTDRTQQRRFPGALRDRDRERVVDHERSDDESDDREHHQEHVDELQRRRTLVLLGFLRRLGTGDDFERSGRARRSGGSATSCCCDTPGVGDDLDRRVRARVYR